MFFIKYCTGLLCEFMVKHLRICRIQKMYSLVLYVHLGRHVYGFQIWQSWKWADSFIHSNKKVVQKEDGHWAWAPGTGSFMKRIIVFLLFLSFLTTLLYNCRNCNNKSGNLVLNEVLNGTKWTTSQSYSFGTWVSTRLVRTVIFCLHQCGFLWTDRQTQARRN